MFRKSTVACVAALCVFGVANSAGASPHGSNSPNLEGPFEVECDGVGYTLLDAPANVDHAEFTPAFVVGTNKVVIPFSFDTTATAVALTDGTVLDGVLYNAGDVIFSESETTGQGLNRPGGRTCTFGGEGVDTFPDDNGTLVDVQFSFSGTALALFPNSR